MFALTIVYFLTSASVIVSISMNARESLLFNLSFEPTLDSLTRFGRHGLIWIVVLIAAVCGGP